MMYFALTGFILFALAAVVIDMGFVMVTQRLMEPGAEAAALEGLRHRDDLTIADPLERDRQRRERASALVTWLYDDNLNPTDGDALPIGAGPLITMTGGVTDAMALQTITLGDPPVFKPRLQTNHDTNEKHGDMVAGAFTLNPDYPADDPRAENAIYDRRDFLPETDSDTVPHAPAFLVRIRRTNNFEGLDDLPGESSHGPTMPLLLGRGSLVSKERDPALNPNNYSIREHGVSVRATHIAEGRPVIAVGRRINPDSSNDFAGLRGITDYALEYAVWTNDNLFPNGSRTAVTVDMRGNIYLPTRPGVQIGFFHNRDATAGATYLGQELVNPGAPVNVPAIAPASPAEQNRLDLYVPLYRNLGDGTLRVVGFGHASMTVDGGGQVRIRKLGGAIAPANATTSFGALPNGVDATILTIWQTLNQADQRSQVLLAPVLVR
ncbi:MAG: hypothetical protein ACK4RK_10055 [Gemmataceae bacterium]